MSETSHGTAHFYIKRNSIIKKHVLRIHFKGIVVTISVENIVICCSWGWHDEIRQFLSFGPSKPRYTQCVYIIYVHCQPVTNYILAVHTAKISIK